MPEAQQRIGEHLRLIEEIGRGAMGQVWRAEDTNLGRQVAVKLVALDSPGITSLERFKREAALAAKLKSPHVVQIFEHGVADGVPYIAMELLDGESLAARIAREGALNPAVAVEIVKQIARALEAAHALGIVHRDVKPANVFLASAPGYETFVKVVDFGIAKDTSSESPELTATGAALGTPYYMSPEQLTSTSATDRRADLWALAVVAYELLTGGVPFRGDTLGAIAIAVSRGSFARASRSPGVAETFDPWFERAFALEADVRWPTARAMAESLDAAAKAADPGASSDPRSGPREPQATLENAPTEEFLAAQVAEAPAKTESSGSSAAAPVRDNRARNAFAGVALVGVAASIAYFSVFRSPAPTASSSPTATATASASASAELPPPSSIASSSAPRAEADAGNLPSEYIQGVVRDAFPAFTACRDLPTSPKHAMLRTLRWVIDVEGKPRGVHVMERDPASEAFDDCLADKFSMLVFPRPIGGVVTVSYPIVFGGDPPLSDQDCQLTPQCREYGRCSARGEGCTVAKSSDCGLSRICVERGWCETMGSSCTAPRVCDAKSSACLVHGLCHSENGYCAALTDDDCKASQGCERYGQCAALKGHCAATTDAHCKETDACRERGLCAASSGFCSYATAESCKASERCKLDGVCSERTSECIALTDADCKASLACTQYGNCTPNRIGTCSATREEDCRASDACKTRRACVLEKGGCVAR